MVKKWKGNRNRCGAINSKYSNSSIAFFGIDNCSVFSDIIVFPVLNGLWHCNWLLLLSVEAIKR